MSTLFRISFSLVWILSSFSLSFAQTEYKLKWEDAGGSCFNYSVFQNEQKLTLPSHIQKSLDCPYMVGLKANFLVFVDELKVKLYNLKSKKEFELFQLYNDIDGFSGPAWSDKSNEVLFVVINQEQKHGYSAMCRIIYVRLNKFGDIKDKRKFDRPVNFECGSICGSEPDNDFRFNSKGNIEFRKHLMLTDGDEIWEEIEL